MLRLIGIWTELCAELCVLCAAVHKRGLCTYIVSLGVIISHTLCGVFIPTAKVISASADLTDIHSSKPIACFRCRKVFGLVWHLRRPLPAARNVVLDVS
jgi:hypothetical protein